MGVPQAGCVAAAFARACATQHPLTRRKEAPVGEQLHLDFLDDLGAGLVARHQDKDLFPAIIHDLKSELALGKAPARDLLEGVVADGLGLGGVDQPQPRLAQPQRHRLRPKNIDVKHRTFLRKI